MSALSEAMDFDHVIYSFGDGTFESNPDSPFARSLHAPDAVDVDSMATELDGWQLPLSGFTGQDRYTGPWLHGSEQIEGGVEMYVLEHPGYWVAIYGQHTCEECSGAGLVYDADGVEVDCPKIATGECEPGGTIEGWTLAFKAVDA